MKLNTFLAGIAANLLVERIVAIPQILVISTAATSATGVVVTQAPGFSPSSLTGRSTYRAPRPITTTICQPCPDGSVCPAICIPITTVIHPYPQPTSTFTTLPTTPYKTTICEPCPTGSTCILICKPITTTITPLPVTTPYETVICEPCPPGQSVCPAICKLITSTVTPTPALTLTTTLTTRYNCGACLAGATCSLPSCEGTFVGTYTAVPSLTTITRDNSAFISSAIPTPSWSVVTQSACPTTSCTSDVLSCGIVACSATATTIVPVYATNPITTVTASQIAAGAAAFASGLSKPAEGQTAIVAKPFNPDV